MRVILAGNFASRTAGAGLLFPQEKDIQAEAIEAGAEALWLLVLSTSDEGQDLSGIPDAANSPEDVDAYLLGAAMALPGKDGVMLVWPPRVRDGLSESVTREVEDRLLERLQNVLTEARQTSGFVPWAYAQAVADGQELARFQLLTRIGFAQVGRIVFLGKDLQTSWNLKSTEVAKPARRNEQSPGDDDWQTMSFHEMGAPEAFADVLHSTLEGSLDLPCLDGLRSGAQMLMGHLQSPRFCNDLTRVAFVKNRPVAVGMLCEDPERATIEVSYLGVVSGQRGHKFGQRLLRELELRAVGRGQRWAILAVDVTNHFAVDLYGDCGYLPLFYREVFIGFSSAS